MTESNDLMAQKLRCVDLLLGCPRDRQTTDCPFQELRQKEVVARVNWLKGLDRERIEALLASHEKCLSKQ